MKTISENRAFGGVQGVYSHASEATGTDMTFGLFLPAEAEEGLVPVLWYLSGLTCTHENAMVKAGAQRWAAEVGIALVFPDTSPRGEDVPNDAAYDLGQGAGFYVNATQSPWDKNFRHVGLRDRRVAAASCSRRFRLPKPRSRSPGIRWAGMAR